MEAKAIKDIADAVGDNDLLAMFLLVNRYIEGMRKLAESSNAKMMVLPADIMAAVRGKLGRWREINLSLFCFHFGQANEYVKYVSLIMELNRC